MKQIPEHIFKAAKKYDGIPLDFHEDEDALVIIMTDGRKITEEKESGTKKRIQRAEAEQAAGKAVEAEAEHNKAVEAEREAYETMNRAKERAKALRTIADGTAAPTAASTPPAYDGGAAPEPPKTPRPAPIENPVHIGIEPKTKKKGT